MHEMGTIASKFEEWLGDKIEANGGRLRIHIYFGESKSVEKWAPANIMRQKELKEKRLKGGTFLYKNWKPLTKVDD
jgi:hypothetical protein